MSSAFQFKFTFFQSLSISPPHGCNSFILAPLRNIMQCFTAFTEFLNDVKSRPSPKLKNASLKSTDLPSRVRGREGRPDVL